MKNIFTSLGLDDGEGNISSTRMLAFLFSVGYIASKFYNAHLTKQPITFDGTDLGFIGTIGGMLIVKTHVEKPSNTVK